MKEKVDFGKWIYRDFSVGRVGTAPPSPKLETSDSFQREKGRTSFYMCLLQPAVLFGPE
jgi:hypothetical protein